MSGFEHYLHELAALDREIRHLAVACQADLPELAGIASEIAFQRGDGPAARAREDLRGLLQLRLKVETEMLELGMKPPAYAPPPQPV